MGMAASQARLIALNARMSDIEYQGQQINQQRTTLSSQINELYNSLLDMDVPTPPSTLDFQKTVYSGITGATKFEMSNVIPTGKNPAGRDTYSVDLAYQMTGHAVTPAALSVNVTQAGPTLYFNEAPQWAYMVGNIVPRYEVPDQSDALTQVSLSDTVIIGITASEYTQLNANTRNNVLAVYTKEDSGLRELGVSENINQFATSNEIVYLKIPVLAIKDDDPGSGQTDLKALLGFIIPTLITPTTQITIEDPTHYTYNEDLNEIGSAQEYSGFKTDSQIASANLYAVDTSINECFHITSRTELEAYLAQSNIVICQLGNSGSYEHEIPNPNYTGGTGLTVGNMPVYNMDDPEVVNTLGQASYDDYIEALRHSFPAFEGDDIASYFYVYIETLSSGQLKPHFMLKSDLSQLNQSMMSAKVYDYDEDGTYTSVTKTPDCELEFDVSTGRIARLGIPDGNGQIIWHELTTTTKVDQQAYDAAFNNYEYEKAEYDKEQQLINAKTSVIHNQDKNLELKLTRLDNERNAVKTEIDAVQKVIQDNIESSYKTFSG